MRNQSFEKGQTLTSYDKDVVAWSREQAGLLRAGRLDELDTEHIADEIEDVGRAEIRELTRRMAALLGYLIEWRFSPARRRPSCDQAIHRLRDAIARRLRRMPSLEATLSDSDFWADAWDDAIETVANDLLYVELPWACPWSTQQILTHDFLPDPTNTPDD